MRLMSLSLTAILLAVQFIPGPRQPGAITGRVDIKAPAPEQIASRYPSPAGQGQKNLAVIPTVVFIDGQVAGAPGWPQTAKSTVVQRNFEFSPSLLIIPKNTIVAFPNEDSEFHNVFSYSKAKRFDLGRYRKGEAKTVVFDKPGIIKVYCEIHPWMRAAILVLENRFFGIASADGSFSITGIPAGHYDLVVWNIDAGSARVGVDVQAGKAPDLRIELSGGSATETMEQKLRMDALAANPAPPADPLTERACCAGKR